MGKLSIANKPKDGFFNVETHPIGPALDRAVNRWLKVNSGRNGTRIWIGVRLNGKRGDVIIVWRGKSKYLPECRSHKFMTAEDYLARGSKGKESAGGGFGSWSGSHVEVDNLAEGRSA
jgi:hypothetical protein